MNPDCLQYAMTSDEQAQFERDGFLAVENALNPEQLETIIAAVDRIDSKERSDDLRDKLLSVTNVLHRDPSFVDMVDWPTFFPKVWSILGWNIYVYHSHMDVTPPATDTTNWRVAWHQDSMRVNDEIETHPRPRLSLKVGIYLTDVTEPDRGNTLVVPGSHKEDELDCPQDGQSNPQGAEPLLVPAGTAVILDRRCWHSRSLNTSELTRKVLWIGYSYRWLKPKDDMTVAPLIADADPIRRQLLGVNATSNGVYDPVDDDVPLRTWLSQHQPKDAEWTKHPRPQSRPPAMVRGMNAGRQ
ncbi:MAG: hypothetical protein CMJ78_23510 [Planctomycetaceae bacterium]|nr:hypothetical protein [Planctomycetaceae bacterium]